VNQNFLALLLKFVGQDSYKIIIYNNNVVVCSMDPSIQLLEIAPGLKNSLMEAGLSIRFILTAGPSEVASILGIESYVAKIIFDAAKKIVQENSLLTDTTPAAAI
jgi:hypothetical protein